MDTIEQNRELVLQRDIPFARSLVWKAMTDPAHVNRWWGPDGFVNENVSMDLRVGGSWTFDMVGPDGRRYPNHSVFREITPPSRLVFSLGEPEREWCEMTVTLEAIDTGTRVTLRQVYPSQAARDEVIEKSGAIEGGRQHLARLEGYVAEVLAGEPA